MAPITLSLRQVRWMVIRKEEETKRSPRRRKRSEETFWRGIDKVRTRARVFSLNIFISYPCTCVSLLFPLWYTWSRVVCTDTCPMLPSHLLFYPAALKCRQRKKAWLAQLQAKVEYLTNENERLTSALVTAREEISRLSSLVGGVGVSSNVNPHSASHHPHAVTVTSGPVPQGMNGVNMNGVGMNGSGHGHHQQGPGTGGNAPISVNVSMSNGKTATMVGGARGYGY